MNINNSCYFSDSKEELEYYKFNYYQKNDELTKCIKKIKILENFNNNLLKKLKKKGGSTKMIKNNENNKSCNVSKDHISSNQSRTTRVMNDNNSQEISPKEFKMLWESIIQTELTDNFDFCLNEYILISHLCQDMILLIYNESQNEIYNKFNDVLKCLNLDKIPKNKFSLLYNEFLPFFRIHLNNIFIFQNSFLDNIHKKLISIIKEYNYDNIKVKSNNSNYQFKTNDKSDKSNDFNISMPTLLEKKINDGDFDNLIKNFFNICIYMLLHDPVLSFDINKYSERKCCFKYYDKNNSINVEGFGNEKSPCILLLPPPLLKNKYPFNGLRSAVYIISEPDNYIYSQCEHNRSKNKEKKIKVYKNKEEKSINKIIDNYTEIKYVKIKKNGICQNNIRSNSNNIDLITKKNRIHNNISIESFNFNYSPNTRSNNNISDIKKQNIKNDKLLISNSLGDIINKNNNKKNKINNKNLIMKKYINKNIDKNKDKLSTKNSFLYNSNFLSIKHNTKIKKLILSNIENNNSFKNNRYNYINKDNNGNKTPNITRKTEKIYKSFQNSIYKNKFNFDIQEKEYIHDKIKTNNCLYDKNNKYNYNENINKSQDFNMKINNHINQSNHYNAFSTIKNPEKSHIYYNSDIKFRDKNINKNNINLYISNSNDYKYKTKRKNNVINKLNKNYSIDYKNDNILYSNNVNDDSLIENDDYQNNSLFESMENVKYVNNNDYYNIENINNSHNYNKLNKKVHIIKINNNQLKNMVNKGNTKSKAIKENIINNYILFNEKNVHKNKKHLNVLYLKNKNNNELLNSGHYNINNNKQKRTTYYYKKNKDTELNNLLFNDNYKNDLYQNNNKMIEYKKTQKNARDNYLSQEFINYNDNNNNFKNSFINHVYYINNKNKESKTIDTDRLISKKYINKNISYNNIFYKNEEKSFNGNNHNKKFMNYSNMYDRNYDKIYNNNKICMMINYEDYNHNYNNRQKHNLFHYYNLNKLEDYNINNNNNCINSSLNNVSYKYQYI